MMMMMLAGFLGLEETSRRQRYGRPNQAFQHADALMAVVWRRRRHVCVVCGFVLCVSLARGMITAS